MTRAMCIALALLAGAACVERNPYYEEGALVDIGADDVGPVDSRDGAILGGDTGWIPADGASRPADAAPVDAAPVEAGPDGAPRDGQLADAVTVPDAKLDATEEDARLPVVDQDEDGVPAHLDCDDENADVYPGAEEVCDGDDDDCDGRADEAFPIGQPCSVGLGACARTGRQRCTPDGAAQCDAVPAAPVEERCNGRDDDCDGEADEGVLNVCGGCGDDLVERCNGRDDDCDGRTDEGWGLEEACFDGVGACRRGGVIVCDGAGESRCSAHAAPPRPETCDGLDDDCDGPVDEGFGLGLECAMGVGECGRSGTLQCTAGGDAACSAVPGPPQPERCNAVDDDCDGVADEGYGVGEVCFQGVGACRIDGRQICAIDGGDVICLTPAPIPDPEICNGADDDCDGTVDEGVLNACGACGPLQVEACDGRDNDCDGDIDEGVLNACGECGNPPEEICDANDQDCDGQVDEGLGICVVGLASLRGFDDADGFGALIADAGDVNADGVPDAFVAAPSGDRGSVAVVDGQTGQLVWRVTNDGDFGTAITAFRLAAGDPRVLFVGAPDAGENGTVYLYSGAGLALGQVVGDDGFQVGKALVGMDGGAALTIGDPNVGLLESGALRLLNPTDPMDAVTINGGLGERLGERLFICPDLDRDGVPELLATVRYNFLRNRGAVLFGSGDAGDRSGRIAPQEPTNQFGQGFGAGDFRGDGNVILAFGDPGADRSRGQVHLFVGGEFLPRALSTGGRNDGQGAALATLPRAQGPDALVVGSAATEEVEIWLLRVRDDDAVIEERIPVTRQGVGSSFGRAVVVSEPAADGTRRLFIGEPDAGRGQGTLHVFSIR